MSTDPPRITPYGESALLVEVAGDRGAALQWDSAIRAAALDGVDETVPAATTVLVRVRHGTDLDGLTGRLRGLTAAPLVEAAGPLAEIPVRYDGADLTDVAELTGLAVDEVVERHLAPTYRVLFCGFAPGFGYLDGLDPALHVSRLDQPRTRVPAGAVAIAGAWAAVYPQASPGGWRLLGSTETPLWDITRDPPALLTPGTRVRFTVAS